ncbi:polysaccharide biosynthesis/export family protein [Verrucomicrobiota bacterium]
MKNFIETIAGKKWVFCLIIPFFLSACVSSLIEKQKVARYKPRVEEMRGPVVSGQAAPILNEVKPQEEIYASSRPPLRCGDALQIYMRGIPNPEDISDVVDGQGNINLPLVKTIKVEGSTSFEAESAIEKAYINGGYYKKINIIIVEQQGEYFVRGEVKKEGKFPLSGNLTLLRVIAVAGGYTDYAKRSQIKIIRGDKVIYVDASRIEKLKDKDPPVKSGDIIIVPRRMW